MSIFNKKIALISEFNKKISYETLIKKAKECGADAIKLQTYTADTITIDHDGPGFIVEGGLWNKKKLYDLVD